MRLGRDFFERDVLVVAPELVGKVMVWPGVKTIITEVEAYGGEEDQASHARFGKTKRNAVMYERGGLLYVYLVYGMHWMLNIVTCKVGKPQAVLIRGVAEVTGPGKVTQALGIDKSFNGEDVTTSKIIWIEKRPDVMSKRLTRIGVNYAGEWAKKPWRFRLVRQPEGGGKGRGRL